MKSSKQRRAEIKAQRSRKSQRTKQQERDYKLARGRMIEVDPAKLNLEGWYLDPPRFYEDQPFDCIDCGAKEVWTAAQQQWWYETIGAPLYKKAVRCRPCRTRLKEQKEPAHGLDADKLIGAKEDNR